MAVGRKQMEQRTKEQRMNHAEKVKSLIEVYAGAYEESVRQRPPEGAEVNYKATETELHAAIDQMQAEIDRLKEWQERAFRARPNIDMDIEHQARYIQQNLPPLPDGAGDYFLDGDKWVRCNDPGPQERGDKT